MELKQIQLSESLIDIARIGIVLLRQLYNGGTSVAIQERLRSLAEDLRRSVGDRPLSNLEAVQRTRKLYHLLGVDPTKDRPGSERLLRRAVQNRTIPQVNPLVDAMNLASLSLQCPIGVYDWDKIVPPVLVRIGRPDEGYVGVKMERMRLDGRLVLVDGEGLFGNPSQDSARTLVAPSTVRALVVVWTSAETPMSHLEAVLKEVSNLARECCDARLGESGILG